MDDLLKSIVDPTAWDKEILASKVDSYLDRQLKLLQVLHYSKQLLGDKEAENIAATYGPVIGLLNSKVSEAVKEYQDKHGEI